MCKVTICVAFFSTLLLSGMASAEKSSENCMLIRNAQIFLPARFDNTTFGHANYGHEIKAGAKSVVLIRNMRSTDGVADSQFFSKTTLELEPLPNTFKVGDTKTVKVLRSFHSEGNAGFVYKGAYSWRNNILNNISLAQNSQGLKVILDATFIQTRADFQTWPKYGEKQSKHLVVTCVVSQMSFADFSAKVGKSGTDWSSFYSTEK